MTWLAYPVGLVTGWALLQPMGDGAPPLTPVAQAIVAVEGAA